MSHDRSIQPTHRLWTPWRMAYVGGAAASDCVFCEAVARQDDWNTLIVHRGAHSFVILNLYPYNTGHLMVVPNDHVSDPGALSPETRLEMAELTASFCTGMRKVMGCDGFNIGVNLGSAAGAGIADHLHQHIVPRWTGDANFMPIIGGTKVLPELLPATYAKLRAEVAREKSGSDSARMVLISDDRTGVFLAEGALPTISLEAHRPVWRSAMAEISTTASHCELAGWAGDDSTMTDTTVPPALAYTFTARSTSSCPYMLTPLAKAEAALSPDEWTLVNHAVTRFPTSQKRP